MQTKEPSAQQQQIKLINELCRLQNKFKKVKKTLIIPELFSSQDDNLYLHNAHAIAQILLDTSLQVKIQQASIGYRSYADKLHILNKSKKIKTESFQLGHGIKGSNSLTNIVLHELEEEDVRVVVIPIQSDLTDISQLREEQEQLEAEDKGKKKQFSDQNLQYQALSSAQAAWEKVKAQKFQKSCEFAKEKHLKMFKIEAFVKTFLQKTQTYSICCLAEVNMRRQKSIDLIFQKEFPKIFKVPKEVKPQCIFYSYNPEAQLSSQANHQLVTTVLSSIKDEFRVERIDCFNPQYFYKPQNVRTQIYENVVKIDNKAINKVIQDFVDGWNKITVETASCIATVVKLANENLNLQRKSAPQDLNSSMTDLSSSMQISSNALSFPKIGQKYIDSQLWFPQKEILQQFYTSQRLGDKIKVEKGYPKIPESIECLVFIHFFNKLINSFLEKYRLTEIESKNDQIILLMEWKRNLKQLYELANAMNETFLDREKNCSDNMQRFFDFLMFTIDSSQKIKKITNRDIATASSLKSVFDQLLPKRDKLLSYIISNQRAIKPNETIHYYDLYLLIIRQNATPDMQSDLEYIQLHIHELKAFRIASQYIWDHQKLVQAVKSYARIAYKYQKLNQKKRQSIDILQIQKRMARLLKILGQQQFAAEIYFKNRDLFFANNCCKQVLAKYKVEDKAGLLIRWGEKFQREFQYDLAHSYYLMAFSYAKSIIEKQNALQHKMKLIDRRSKPLSEEERVRHDKFNKDSNLIDYCSEIKLGEMFNQLSKCLTWDKILGCSVLTKGYNPEAGLQESILMSP